MNLLQFLGSIEIGLIYALAAIGVFITFKIIDFPDLTVDGSFTLGAAVSAILIVNGYSFYLATIAAIIAGGIAGAVTGYLNVKWNIMGLLAGILTMTALYSVNLRIMQRPNIAIITEPTIFSLGNVIFVTAMITILILVLLTRFFASDFGLAIRAAGINPKVSSSYGINIGIMKIVALVISNSIVALAGSLFAQSQGFADISLGTSTVIVGLASVIIGEAILRPEKILTWLVACVFGSVIYRIAIASALNADEIGLEASDLNLITAALVAVTLKLRKIKI